MSLTPTQSRQVRDGRNASARRGRWEAGPGADRMRDLRDLHGVTKPDAEGRGGYTLGQMYQATGADTALASGIDPAHDVHDDQPHLPGLEQREAAPRTAIDPTGKAGRWEDLAPDRQTSIRRRVKAKSGATIDSMRTAYGAQLDQSVHRAAQRGAVPPHFYGGGEPAEVIHKTVDDLGITRGAVSALHADNSPQTPFATGKGATRRYPQDEMARAAVHTARTDPDAASRSNAELAATKPPRAMGYTSNYAKSVRRAAQMEGGVPAGDTNPNSSTSGFGPKTGPYQRAWTGSTSSQFVSDVHSGGGGMVPHLGTDKDGGNSEREGAIATSGFHLMADFAARSAHRDRGLHMPVKRGQEAQWVEEQIQRPDHSAVPQTEESVYGARQEFGPTTQPDPPEQGRLFPDSKYRG